MLDHLKKYFSAKADNTVAEATNKEEEVTMTTPVEQPVLTAVDETADLAAQLASESAVNAELKEQLASLLSKFEAAQAELANLSDVKANLEKAAAEAKVAKRKESLEHAVGTEKASQLLASLELLDDAAFDNVVSAMTVNLDKEASSETFTEKGVVAEADKAEVDPVQKLAEAFANKFTTK